MLRNVLISSLFLAVVALLGAAATTALAKAPYVAAGTPEQPSDLGKIEGVLTFEAQTGVGQMRDSWFAFTLSRPARIEISVEPADVTFDLRVEGGRDIDGVLRSNAFSREPSFEHDVDAGTYWLRTYADQLTRFTTTIKTN